MESVKVSFKSGDKVTWRSSNGTVMHGTFLTYTETKQMSLVKIVEEDAQPRRIHDRLMWVETAKISLDDAYDKAIGDAASTKYTELRRGHRNFSNSPGLVVPYRTLTGAIESARVVRHVESTVIAMDLLTGKEVAFDDSDNIQRAYDAVAEKERREITNSGVGGKPHKEGTAVNHPAHYNMGGIECIDALRGLSYAGGVPGFL